MHRYKLSLKNV
uniref:Uncharacterized protein n=1 Tax=Knipowitschia caucasica TaxID=637954 RepID=A0AAV2JM28_KNICA